MAVSRNKAKQQSQVVMHDRDISDNLDYLHLLPEDYQYLLDDEHEELHQEIRSATTLEGVIQRIELQLENELYEEEDINRALRRVKTAVDIAKSKMRLAASQSSDGKAGDLNLSHDDYTDDDYEEDL